MAEQQLDGAQIGAGFEQVNGKGMAEQVRRDRLVDVGLPSRLSAGGVDRQRRNRLSGQVAGEQPLFGAGGAPVAAQQVEQHGREHDVAVLAPFALFDADDHALAVDGGGGQTDGLRNPQTRRIADGQDDAVLQHLDGIEEPAHLVAAQHDRQMLRPAAGRNVVVDVPVSLEDGFVEEAQGGHRDRNRACGEFPLLVRWSW